MLKKIFGGKKLVKANYFEVTESLKSRIIAAIERARENMGEQVRFFDSYTDVSYCVSMEKDHLIISIIDYTDRPNASLLSFLKKKVGNPTTLYAKPWVQNPNVTIFYMIWDKPVLKL